MGCNCSVARTPVTTALQVARPNDIFPTETLPTAGLGLFPPDWPSALLFLCRWRAPVCVYRRRDIIVQ